MRMQMTCQIADSLLAEVYDQVEETDVFGDRMREADVTDKMETLCAAETTMPGSSRRNIDGRRV